MAVDLSEGVLVLIAFEPAPAHAVLKVMRPVVGGDPRLVHLRKAELPSMPDQPIVGLDQLVLIAFERMHLQGAAHELDARTQKKASIERRIYMCSLTYGVHL